MLNILIQIPEKKFIRLTWIVTAVVFILVVLIKSPWLPKPSMVSGKIYILPLLNALLNASCFFLLLASFWAIKKKNISLHRRLNTVAMVLSMVFLLSYVVFHSLVSETVYGDSNKDFVVDDVEISRLLIPRGVYLFILFSHIVLAAMILPFILQIFYFGSRRMDDRHRKLARIIYPFWLYVAATGVLVYVLVSPYY